MKRVFRFLARRWVITLIGLLALSLLIWFAGPLVSIADRVPLAGVLERIIAILVVFLLWALNLLRRHLLARRADSQLVEGLADAEAQAVDSGDQASAEEVAQISERFEDAITLLRKAGRKRGARSLYELPWYILVGPPGSGKTTILRNSGLDFPLADHLGNEALKGIGGTRNCDWWISNEAVLIDTAGRYTTQDSDQQVDKSAWEGFLDLLKKYRRRRPINGVLIAISLSDLITQSEHERSMHARAIKQRLQELYKHFGMRFPVYVMFTKADLIAGFSDFFEDLGREEREQVWGTTFPFDEETREPLKNANSEFGLLVQRLNDRLLWRLNQERDIERRARILNFPRQFASLEPTLLRFLDEIFRPSRFDEVPLLRGIYFTSGTQEGTPIDRLMGQLGRAFGLHPEATAIAPKGPGKSFFVTDLLNKVIFPERDLAGVDRRFERQRVWLQRAAYAGAVAALVVGLFAWITSYTGNSNYLHEIGGEAGQVESLVAKPVPADADFPDIVAELDAAAALARDAARHEDDTPWSMRFGLYQGGMVAQEARDAYARLLNGLLLPKIANRLEQQLASGVDDPDFRYEALKLYLMLGNTERLEPELLKDWMQIDWENRYPGDAKLRGHLQEHLAALIELGPKPMKLNRELIKRQRAFLKQVPLAELVYGRLKREYLADDQMPFRVTDAAGQNADKVFIRRSGRKLDEVAVPGLFTYRGFYEVYGKESLRLVKQFQREDWVLGGEGEGMTKQELKQLEKDLRDLYLDDYIAAWDKLLADLRIVPFRGVNHASEVLDLLAGSTSPLERLLKGVERNTTLGRLPPGADKLADIAGEALKRRSRLARIVGQTAKAGAMDRVKKPGDRVDEHFERLNIVVRGEKQGTPPIKRITDTISDVYGYISTLQGGSLEEALDAAKGGNDGIKTMQRLRILAARQPEPVKTWLSQLYRRTRGVTLGGAHRELSKKWKAAVLPVCNKALLKRYPFKSGAQAEATLRDFGRFFGEGGVMDRFFQEQLAQFVDTSRSPWRWRKGAGRAMGLSRKVLRQFQRAAEIKEAFFQDGGQLPSVHFTLKPVYLDPGVDKFLLELEGQTFTYRHGPAVAKKADWPGPRPAKGVRLVYEKRGKTVESLRMEGPWAWFRLLDKARIQRLGDDRLLITFDVGGRKARYELRANSVYNPFQLGELHRFRCPGAL